MAMLSARFHDAAVAQQVRDKFVNEMGAMPDLVISALEGAVPVGGAGDGVETDGVGGVHPVEAIRVSIYDNTIDTDSARNVLKAAGGTDIRPTQ